MRSHAQCVQLFIEPTRETVVVINTKLHTIFDVFEIKKTFKFAVFCNYFPYLLINLFINRSIY